MAHGLITTLKLDDARGMPDVALVIAAANLAAAGVKMGLVGSTVKNLDGTRSAAPIRPILAQTHVRHVGEAVVMIVADTMDNARDAAEVIGLDIDDLPVHVDVTTGGEVIHPEAPRNLAFDWALGDLDSVQSAIGTAAHVVRVDIPENRIICNAMEPRGCFKELEDGRLHVAVNGQGVWAPKADLMHHFGLSGDDVRVTNPDVGGGFGMKDMRYPETFCVAHAARVLGRSVRWMSDRTEAMLTDNAGRDLVTTATLAFDADHRIVAYHLDMITNMGVYNSQFAQGIRTDLFSKVLTGIYDMSVAAMQVQGVYTNTTPVDAYRGAGRPEAIFVLERAMDQAARELNVDGFALRRKNFITPTQFPYKTVSGVTYDVGEFSELLDVAMLGADVNGFAARLASADGKLRGIGLSFYIESILGDPKKTTRVVFESDCAAIYVGTQSNGQGHETVYAQFLSDQTGIPVDQIRVVQGDSDLIPTGGVVQGLGQALTERVVYDEDGQLLTATFMDYAMPRADNMPMIDFSTRGTPSLYNPMGMKGCGEAGTVGALAAITNAMTDALWNAGVRNANMPFTPHRVWQMLKDARAAA